MKTKITKRKLMEMVSTLYVLLGCLIFTHASPILCGYDWNTDAADGLVELACGFIQHWWWPVAVICVILWIAGLVRGNEKVAEIFKKATISVVAVFIASYAVGGIKTLFEYIAGLFGSAV